MGRGVLPVPPLAGPAVLLRWEGTVGPAAALFGLVRMAVVGLGAAAALWGLASGLGSILASCRRLLARLARAMGWRGAARVILGLSASGGGAAALAGCSGAARTGTAPTSGHGRLSAPPAPVLVGLAPAAAPPAAAPPVTRRPRPAPPPPSSLSPTLAAPSARTAPSAPAPAHTPTAPPAPAPGHTPTATASAPTARLLATWTVRPGDSFWSIAEAVIGQAPAGAERPAIATYWSRLVAANRDRLPHPGDPDLLFAGDVLVLPPLTAGPT
jgi:hypothetical protein